jgi:hypothetical protein
MNSEFEILLWNVYNVLDSDDYHCESKIKNGNECGRKCTMKYKHNDEYIYTCKLHFPKDIQKTKDNDFKSKNINEYLLQDIATRFLQKINDIYNENIEIFQQLDCIFIELQTQTNNKALFMSHILYGKYVELYKNTTIPIRFVRASKKLKAYTGPEIECHLKGSYAKRKWLSIQYMKWFLENKFSLEQKEKWLPIFSSHSKQDDMSDTGLMCINAITLKPPKLKKLQH